MQALLETNRACLGEETALIGHKDELCRPLQRACCAYAEKRDPDLGNEIINQVVALLEPLAEAGVKRVIVSSEAILGRLPTPDRRDERFFESAPEILSAIAQGAKGHEVKFVLYTRSEERWISSLYRYLLLTRGLKMTYEDFRRIPALDGFSFDALLHDISKSVANLTSFRMEGDIGSRLGPGTQLLKFLGYSDQALAQWDPVGVKNESLKQETADWLSGPWIMKLPRLPRKYLAKMADKWFF